MKTQFRKLLSAAAAALCILCLLFPVSVSAETLDAEEPEFTYEQNEDGGITLTGYAGKTENLVIPAEIDGIPVTAIGESCFAGDLTLVKVTVPEGVRSIGDYAFECCGCLKKIYMPESLETIGEGVFSGCVRLVLTDLQEGVKSIGRGAFLNCTALNSIDLPASLETIGAFAFTYCSSLVSVTFNGDLVTELPDRLFYGCSYLTFMHLPNLVTSIGKRAFSGCEKLTYLYFQEEITSLGEYAFEGCSSLRNVDIRTKVLPKEVFAGCKELSYVIMDGVESIGFRAFMSSGVRDIDLPASVSEIAEGAFAVSKIGSITLEENEYFKVINGSLYTADGKTLIAAFPEDPYLEEQPEEFIVPDGVEVISGYAFAANYAVSRVVLPDSVKEVCANAFTDSAVYEAVIPETAEVDPEAFKMSPMEDMFEEHEEAVPEDSTEEQENPEETDDEENEPREVGSIAGDRSLFDPEKYADYLEVSNEEFDAWSEKYMEFLGGYMPTDRDLIPYINLYKGEVIAHYPAMTSVQNHDPDLWQRAVNKFGDDFEETYLMMDHGLFTELRRGRMCDDLILYSGVYDSQLMEAAGTDTVPALEELVDRIGCTFTDPIMISTTTDAAVACNFGETLFIIYASREAMDSLGAVSIDSYVHSHENEILMCGGAEYRILDVGTMEVEVTDWYGETTTMYRNYLKVELLVKDAE